MYYTYYSGICLIATCVAYGMPSFNEQKWLALANCCCTRKIKYRMHARLVYNN